MCISVSADVALTIAWWTRIAAASGDATDYLAKLMEAGEKDTHRLTVYGLTYLRELDGSSDPVKTGFAGL